MIRRTPIKPWYITNFTEERKIVKYLAFQIGYGLNIFDNITEILKLKKI